MDIFGFTFAEAAIVFGAIAGLVKVVYTQDQLNREFKNSVKDQKQSNKELRKELKDDQQELKEELTTQINEIKDGQNKHGEELKDFKQDFVRLETAFNLQSLNLRKEKGGIR